MFVAANVYLWAAIKKRAFNKIVNLQPLFFAYTHTHITNKFKMRSYFKTKVSHSHQLALGFKVLQICRKKKPMKQKQNVAKSDDDKLKL